MLNFFFLFVQVLLEGWSFAQVSISSNRVNQDELLSLPRLTRPCWDAEFLFTCWCKKTDCQFRFYMTLSWWKGFFHPGIWKVRVIKRGGQCMMKSYAFAFAVSTLASSDKSNSPSAERFTFPPWSGWTHERQVWGHQFKLVRWAESGGWCYESQQRMTFLWMSELMAIPIFLFNNIQADCSFY